MTKKTISMLIAASSCLIPGSFALLPAAPQDTDTFSNAPGLPPSIVAGTTSVTFSFSRPSQVQRYYVECSDATRLDVRVADGGIKGDHWQATVKVWDARPNVAQTAAPGNVNAWSQYARVYNLASTPMLALIEVRYRDGINIFGAGGFLEVKSNSSCVPVVTDLGQTDEI